MARCPKLGSSKKSLGADDQIGDHTCCNRPRELYGVPLGWTVSLGHLARLQNELNPWFGRYRTTVDRLLGMKLVPSRRLVRRSVSYDFMNRQMVWHAFTVCSHPHMHTSICFGPGFPNYEEQEFLIFLLPLLPHRKLRRVAGTAVGAVMHPLDTLYTVIPSSARLAFGLATAYDDDGRQKGVHGKLTHLPEDECAICYENAATTLNIVEDIQPQSTPSDIRPTSVARKSEPPTHPLTTPYRASCGHIYCYACVAEKLLRAADEGGGPWECLRCGMPVLGAERFRVENMYPVPEGDDTSAEEWGSDYFDEMGSSSLSGVSAGSQSWASRSDEERSE